MPIYSGKSGDLVGWHQCLTYIQTTEYSAPQLVDSIKFKLSHTIFFFKEHQQKYLCIMFYFFCHSDQRQKHGHNLLWNYGYWLLSKLWDIFLLLPSFLFLILLGYSSPRTQQQVIIIVIIAEITPLITATEDVITISARKDAHPIPSPAHPHTHRFFPNKWKNVLPGKLQQTPAPV